ncbi:MAG: DNA polymerase III subunit delta [Xanthobacteraceae bacterium]
MVALKASEVDRFLARRDSAVPVVLVFGPDAGLVRERTEALIRASVDDPKDPFQLARLDGDELAGEPTRLVEEASTIPLFGGRRAVWVQAGSRNFAAAIEAVLALSKLDCRVVIEAGDLKRNAPLRLLCERAKNAAALPCYPDAGRELARLIDQEIGEAGLTISTDARQALVPLLGGDRLASRQELRKLALFAHGKERIEIDDIVSVIADASALALDALIDAAFTGRPDELEAQLAKAQTAATSSGTIMSAAQRHAAQLHRARLAMDDGASIGDAAGGMQPFLHFSRKAAVETTLRLWTSARLERALIQLGEAAAEARAQSTMAQAITQRALLSLAVVARRKES